MEFILHAIGLCCVSLTVCGIAFASPTPLPHLAITIDASRDLGPLKPLHRDFAQGGESSDADYLEGLINKMRALRPRLVRFDHALQAVKRARRADGGWERDYSEFDKLVAVIREMGAEPLVCLSYMPRELARSGGTIEPPRDPAEWAEEIDALVRHANIVSGKPITYWEVWNEPNLEIFWSGTREEYFELYAASVEGALRADPRIKVGAAGFAWFPEPWVDALLAFVAARGLRLDFLSWHLYAVPPSEYARTAGLARELLARHGLRAELMITEWNYHHMQPPENDTHVGAVYLSEALRRMQDAGIDGAPFFEIRDGWNARGEEFWGRWGMFTFHERPKANYFAFQAWSRLGPLRLPLATSDERVDGIATRDGERLIAILYNASSEPARADCRIVGATRPVYRFTRWLIDETHSNPALRDPGDIALPRLERVERATCVNDSGAVARDILLPAQSVSLLEWRPEADAALLRVAAAGDDELGERLRFELDRFPAEAEPRLHVATDRADERVSVELQPGAPWAAEARVERRLGERPAWRFVQVEIVGEQGRGFDTFVYRAPAALELDCPSRVAVPLDAADPCQVALPWRLVNRQPQAWRGHVGFHSSTIGTQPGKANVRLRPHQETAKSCVLRLPASARGDTHTVVCSVTPEVGPVIARTVSLVPAFPVPRQMPPPRPLIAAWYVSEASPPVVAEAQVGTLQLWRDDDGLHLVAVVYDNKHHQAQAPENMWIEDSLQVAFDTGFDARPGIGYDANDYEYGAARKGGETMTWCWAAGLGRPRGVVAGFDAEVETAPGVTTYRLRFREGAALPAGLSPGRAIGFSLLINDSDGQTRRWCSVGGSFAEQKRPGDFWALLFTD